VLLSIAVGTDRGVVAQLVNNKAPDKALKIDLKDIENLYAFK